MDQQQVAVKPRVHTLTVRLEDEEYYRLRDYVYGVEQKTREKLSHQSVIAAGLREYLTKRGA
jgi:hypothetical protein